MIKPLHDRFHHSPHEEEAPKVPWRHLGILTIPVVVLALVSAIPLAACSSSGGIALVYKTIAGAFVMC